VEGIIYASDDFISNGFYTNDYYHLASNSHMGLGGTSGRIEFTNTTYDLVEFHDCEVEIMGTGASRDLSVNGTAYAQEFEADLFTAGDIDCSQDLNLSGIGSTASGSYLKIYNNYVYIASSSRKTKENVEPLKEDFSKILKAQPVSFIDKATQEPNLGFIAEDFHDLGLENLVVYDQNNEIQGLKYDLVSLYNLEVMKEMKSQIELLQKQNELLEKRIEELEEK